ncbi:MAG TPA: hypothetical protein DD435_12965 [Cyanobacteria bacterium UBA8530]|nr:hypothetical protein [Cyanobacteria bacterium UBA8530]
MKGTSAFALVLCVFSNGLFCPSPCFADSLYNDLGSPSVISDRLGDRRSTFSPGSIVTVVVTEDMQASSGATTRTTKDSRINMSWDFGTIFPKTVKSATDLRGRSDFNGDGSTSRTGKINLEVSSRIQEVLPDGSLRIVGNKNLRINEEESLVTIEGIIRPYDIDALNRISSTKVADLKLDYKGMGPASAKATQGVLTRVLNWLF